jgi:hypothetical protein
MFALEAKYFTVHIVTRSFGPWECDLVTDIPIMVIEWGYIVRKTIFSIKVFVTLLDYLKIPQVANLGELHV